MSFKVLQSEKITSVIQQLCCYLAYTYHTVHIGEDKNYEKQFIVFHTLSTQQIGNLNIQAVEGKVNPPKEIKIP